MTRNSFGLPDFGAAERESAETLLRLALTEDLGERGDVTSLATIPPDAVGAGVFVSRAPGVISGLPVVGLVAQAFRLSDRWEPLVRDGDFAERGERVARIAGPMRALLALERTALNFLQRLSGVATQTRRFVEAVRGTSAVILDTRKTTPGWRALEKYAVRCGGGQNHRFGLHDAVLIKDNHLVWLARQSTDPICEAISAARAQAPKGMTIEVEVESLDQLERALDRAPDIILCDNFDVPMLAEAVRRRNVRGSKVLLETSGGVTLETVAARARTGVDRISVGALTHSAHALDIALDFEEALAS